MSLNCVSKCIAWKEPQVNFWTSKTPRVLQGFYYKVIVVSAGGGRRASHCLPAEHCRGWGAYSEVWKEQLLHHSQVGGGGLCLSLGPAGFVAAAATLICVEGN